MQECACHHFNQKPSGHTVPESVQDWTHFRPELLQTVQQAFSSYQKPLETHWDAWQALLSRDGGLATTADGDVSEIVTIRSKWILDGCQYVAHDCALAGHV